MRVLLLGASSTIAQATARRLAARKHDLILAGRRTDHLETIKQDLEIRYQVNVSVTYFDALDFDRHEALFQEAVAEGGGLSGVLLMYGMLGEQKKAEDSLAMTREMIDVNYTSAVSLLNIAANYFATKQRGRKRRGFIGAVSSVAGDRGRKSNYIYGSTKAGLSAYMQGLRNRLHKSGVHVLTIKPGTVDTKMTAGTTANSPLAASADKVARDIDRALEKRRQNIVYTPWFWFLIMFAAKLLPEWLFKRTNW